MNIFGAWRVLSCDVPNRLDKDTVIYFTKSGKYIVETLLSGRETRMIELECQHYDEKITLQRADGMTWDIKYHFEDGNLVMKAIDGSNWVLKKCQNDGESSTLEI
jgi:hypothetical protein